MNRVYAAYYMNYNNNNDNNNTMRTCVSHSIRVYSLRYWLIRKLLLFQSHMICIK